MPKIKKMMRAILIVVGTLFARIGYLKQNSNRHPASGIRHPASGIRHPASGIRHPASGIRHPASGIRHPASIIPHNQEVNDKWRRGFGRFLGLKNCHKKAPRRYVCAAFLCLGKNVGWGIACLLAALLWVGKSDASILVHCPYGYGYQHDPIPSINYGNASPGSVLAGPIYFWGEMSCTGFANNNERIKEIFSEDGFVVHILGGEVGTIATAWNGRKVYPLLGHPITHNS